VCSKDTIEKIQWLASLKTKEICGVVLKDNSIVEIKNVSTTNHTFIFDKTEWFKLLNTKPEIRCIYHSHVNGDPEPSKDDLACQKRLNYDFLIVAGSKWRYISA